MFELKLMIFFSSVDFWTTLATSVVVYAGFKRSNTARLSESIDIRLSYGSYN